jgi:hypothetical protein
MDTFAFTEEDRRMARTADNNLLQIMRLTQRMLALADAGDRDRDDSACGVIYGILRDSAYQLRKLAKQECEKHRAAGKWDVDEDYLSCG